MKGKRHVPTDLIRGKVEALAAMGYPQEFIAEKVGIAEKTLRKHYRGTLDKAMADADVQVTQRLFKLATDKDVPLDIQFKACKHWTKRPSMGWHTSHVHKGDAANPVAVTVATEDKISLDGFTAEDKLQFARLRKAAREAALAKEQASAGR